MNLGCDPEDASIYNGYSLSAVIVQSLFDGPDITIHLISGLI